MKLVREKGSKNSSSLQPPKFSLKTLLVLVAFVAVTIAMISSMNRILASLFLLTFTMILLHVAGNALGTRLRDGAGNHRQQANADSNDQAFREPIEPTKLSEKKSLGLPLAIATTCGSIVAGGCGYFLLIGYYGSRLEPGALLLGVTAIAALGAFWGFWLWSLFHVALGAWWQAHSASRR